MFYTYLTTNKRNGTLYTGHTDNLERRIFEHKARAISGFSARYGCDKLVWFQAFETRGAAFTKERQIKEWNRAWKLSLIEEMNPSWLDISQFESWPLPRRILDTGVRRELVAAARIES